MEEADRQEYLQTITKKLVIFTGSCLIIIGGFFNIIVPIMLERGPERTYLVTLVFLAGLIGGFVSIQQRLPTIQLNELRQLSQSWSSVLLIPVNGGIFALVLMIMFLSGIVDGPLFPEFEHKTFDFNTTEREQVVKSQLNWFTQTFPKTGPDIAKLLFWSFVAGFSERFVPQIIHRTKEESEKK